MSKSILIIDTPENCDNCQLMRTHFDHGYGWIKECIGSKQNDFYLKLKYDKKLEDYCPLKHVPTKKWYYRDNYSNDEETDKKYEVLKKVYTMIGYFSGWDDCIDEILGE